MLPKYDTSNLTKKELHKFNEIKKEFRDKGFAEQDYWLKVYLNNPKGYLIAEKVIDDLAKRTVKHMIESIKSERGD